MLMVRIVQHGSITINCLQIKFPCSCVFQAATTFSPVPLLSVHFSHSLHPEEWSLAAISVWQSSSLRHQSRTDQTISPLSSLPLSPSVRGPESVVGGVGAKDIIKPLFSLLKGNGNEGDGRCGDGDGRPAAFPVIQRMKSRRRERQNPRQISTTFTG